ncbi:MAG TPA: protoheme IX farnesyltransferase [Bacteroidetes bacterium]|nr:protoheme IX farnesyltransferase [Bacteroidota bacterium]
MNNETSLMSEEKEMKRTVGEFVKDLWLLMKPELTLLSVFTALGSAYLAIKVPDASQLVIFPLLALGTLLVGGGSGVLNQYFEREFDTMMKRTQKRPIPDQRILPAEALLFGIVASLIGTGLLLTINWLTALLAISTLVTYVFMYTPLKRISTIATIIGAIPGALPTLIGWAAIQNSLSYQSLTLFAILYYWQLPHFYSIGWLYREDYSRAGFKLLTNLDIKGMKVSKQILVNQVILIGVSLSPAMVGLVSLEYIPVAILIGISFLLFGIKFNRSIKDHTSNTATRLLFFSSLFYLPIIFSAMIIFKIR